MEKLKKLMNREKLEVYVNKLKFYGETERMSCTEKQNKKLSFRLTKKDIRNKKVN